MAIVIAGDEQAGDGERERLSELLKRCRARIAPQRASLGSHLRSPGRIGKAVTQEEVAEAAGISRVWYAMLETDRVRRVSTSILRRLADALLMDVAEREALFQLALPELRSASLAQTSTAILDAFGSIRRLSRWLWAATTQAEALALAREYATTLFASDTVQTCARLEQGHWDRATTGDIDSAKRYDALIQSRGGVSALDDLCCYTLMGQPGEVLTGSERDARFPDLAAIERPVLTTVGLSDLSFAMANIRSQHGFVARLLVVHHTPHAFSEIERAQLSTLADLTSLALHGSVS